mgnify:CR=1 FL=1
MNQKKFAFTMAEILLSLTIIGVVAAITLPSLTGNINERTWNTQRKALYARMSQAIALMPALNGYGTLIEGDESTSAVDTAAETFVTAGLSKVLKINNICDNEHLADCGIVSEYNNIVGSKKTFPKTIREFNSLFDSSHGKIPTDIKAAAFETANGESVVAFYNPNCTDNQLLGGRSGSGEPWYFSQPLMCANFIYDLNNQKGPNTVGKDIGFITVFYPTDSVVVAPVIYNKNVSGDVTQKEAAAVCKTIDQNLRLPNREELISMFYNRDLINLTSAGANFWSGSVEDSQTGWAVYFYGANWGAGSYQQRLRDAELSVRCIYR